MQRLLLILILFSLLVFLTGCQESSLNDNDLLDTLIDVASHVTAANVASTPANPYALPVGIGLAGITAMLEALRRKERAGRKHAEHALNNGNNKK